MPVQDIDGNEEPDVNENNDFFWTDFEQAHQRLEGTVVLYDNKPVYIRTVEAHRDGIPRGNVMVGGQEFQDRVSKRKMLNSPKFKKFRELPKLGWMNILSIYGPDAKPTPCFLKRRPVRGRLHGLYDGNVQVVNQRLAAHELNFMSLFGDDGFVAMQRGDYPTVEFALEHLHRGDSMAIHPDFCIFINDLGLKYLLRKDERIGLISKTEISLPEHMMFLRDELLAMKVFHHAIVGL